MTRRWTLVAQRIETQDPIKSSEVARQSSGLRYWLLVPFAALVFYLALFWSIIIWLSFLSPLIGPFRRRKNHL